MHWHPDTGHPPQPPRPQSSERRVKLRKVVMELLKHAEELHCHHKHHRKDRKAVTTAAVIGGMSNTAAWDHDTVREVLERKVRILANYLLVISAVKPLRKVDMSGAVNWK